MSGNRTEALIILNGERASCAFPPDHLIYISSAAMLTNDFLGTEIKSRDLAFLLSGQINGLVDWVKTAHELNRGDVRVVLSRVHAQTGLPLVIELINHSQYARLSWRQVTFDSDPEEVAFEPPAGYDPCERPAFLEKIGR